MIRTKLSPHFLSSKTTARLSSTTTSTSTIISQPKPASKSPSPTSEPTTNQNSSKTESSPSSLSTSTTPSEPSKQPQKPKTIAQQDAELREKLEGRSGEGGASGLEYEAGKAVSMKRGVRDNMFRYI